MTDAMPGKLDDARIQRLAAENAAQYRTLMLEAYALHPAAFTSSVSERLELPLSWWQERLAGGSDPDSLVLGALRDDILCGVVGLRFLRPEKERHKASLFGMYVPARCRRLGLGKRLVTTALALARARPGVRLVQLTVTQGNADAQRLYEECGFNAFGVEPEAIAVGGLFFSKILMWCSLDVSA